MFDYETQECQNKSALEHVVAQDDLEMSPGNDQNEVKIQQSSYMPW